MCDKLIKALQTDLNLNTLTLPHPAIGWQCVLLNQQVEVCEHRYHQWCLTLSLDYARACNIC